MKTQRFAKQRGLAVIVLLFSFVFVSPLFAQEWTRWELPEGAIARLGKGGINVMQFSPDGTRLVVGTDIGAWIYDVRDGKEIALLTENTGQINALAFSPDGKFLACGGFANPNVQLWELESGRKHKRFNITDWEGRTGSVSALAFSEDGATLISLNSPRGLITRWDIASGLEISRDSKFYEGDVPVFSPDGKIFAIGARDGKLRVWRTSNGRQRAAFRGHRRFFLTAFISKLFGASSEEDLDIQALAFSPDGKTLASGSVDKSVLLWDAATGAMRASLKGHTGWVTAVAFSVDGGTVASGDADNVIRLWDVRARRERARLTGHTHGIAALCYSPDGKTLVSGSWDGSIQFWDAATGGESTTFATGHTEAVQAVAFSGTGDTVVSGSFNGVVQAWDMNAGRGLTTITTGEQEWCQTLVFAPDGSHFANYGWDAMVAFDTHSFGARFDGEGWARVGVWAVATGDEQPLNEPHYRARGLAFSPDNRTLASSDGREILLSDTTTGNVVARLSDERHVGSGRVLAFSPDGALLAAGAWNAVDLWKLGTKSRLATLAPESPVSIRALAFSPDGTHLAVREGRGVCLWNVKTGEEVQRFLVPGLADRALTFSPDGRVLLCGGQASGHPWRKGVQLWDVQTGVRLGTLTAHTAEVTALVFAPDGETLASASGDGTVLLWDWDEVVSVAAPANR